MSLDDAYEYARHCVASWERKRSFRHTHRHESAFYVTWDYILKAVFPLDEGYTVASQFALVEWDAINAQGPTPEFVICTKDGYDYKRVSFMVVEIKKRGHNKMAAEEQLFRYMDILATKFEIKKQEFVYGLLCVGLGWGVYRLTIGGQPDPEALGDWLPDFSSVDSRDYFRTLKEQIVAMVADALKKSMELGEERSPSEPSWAQLPATSSDGSSTHSVEADDHAQDEESSSQHSSAAPPSSVDSSVQYVEPEVDSMGSSSGDEYHGVATPPRRSAAPSPSSIGSPVAYVKPGVNKHTKESPLSDDELDIKASNGVATTSRGQRSK